MLFKYLIHRYNSRRVFNEILFYSNKKIIDFVKRKNCQYMFSKGIKKKFKEFNEFVRPSGINIDYEVEPEWENNLKL